MWDDAPQMDVYLRGIAAMKGKPDQIHVHSS